MSLIPEVAFKAALALGLTATKMQSKKRSVRLRVADSLSDQSSLELQVAACCLKHREDDEYH